MTGMFVAAAAVASTACYDPTGPVERLEIGTAWFYSQPAFVDIPDTVSAGEPFTVTVRTFGGGCDRMGRTDVARGDTEAVVVPMDYTLTGANLGCPDILRWFEHEASITFPRPGGATVAVRAVREPEDTVETVSRIVWVR